MVQPATTAAAADDDDCYIVGKAAQKRLDDLLGTLTDSRLVGTCSVNS